MRSNDERGFTLIEMIVVLTVMTLMIGILVARGPTRSPSLDLTAASRALTDALRHARGQAIATDQPVQITADQARTAVAALMVQRRLAAPIMLELHSPPDDPHANGAIRFNPDGSANGASLVLTENRARLTMLIDWLTGRISQGPVQCCDAR